MRFGASNREAQRCVEGNGVLSFEAHRVVHSQCVFFFSFSLSLPYYRESADATGGRAMHGACSFVLHERLRDYMLSPVTNRWKPLGTRSFPRDQQVEDACGCVADDSETRPAKRDGRDRREGGRWTIRELLLFQLVSRIMEWHQNPVARERTTRPRYEARKNPATTVVRGIFSFLIGQTAQNDKYRIS